MPDIGHIDERELRAWRAFLAAHATVISKLGTEMKDQFDLPVTWYDVLVQLFEAGGRLRMHELAGSLLLSRSATTRFVDRLEKADLICREACPDDRRGTFVTLTPQGRARLEEIGPSHIAGVRRHFIDLLSDAQIDVLAEALEKLAIDPSDPSDRPGAC